MVVEMELDEHLKKSLLYANSQAVQMRRILDSPKGQLLLAVKKASSMLGELRTSKLSPKLYYELYNACFDALSQLQSYLIEVHHQHHLADVYEIVQYTGNVLPRLYLMVTVGTAFMETGDAPLQEVLKDMLEMARGVQHPLRGLFLRYYLGQRTAPFITKYTATQSDLNFNVRFTLTNFIEMNKLWVRYQHQGHSRDFQQRTEERIQLETIVGSSILRLAQIDAIGISLFSNEILPSILEQIIQCRDKLAQEYLLDILVHVFPAEFHLETLDMFLESLEFVTKDTSVAMVLEASMTRLIGYVLEKKDREQTLQEKGNTAKDVENTETAKTTENTKDVENTETKNAETPEEAENTENTETENTETENTENPETENTETEHTETEHTENTKKDAEMKDATKGDSEGNDNEANEAEDENNEDSKADNEVSEASKESKNEAKNDDNNNGKENGSTEQDTAGSAAGAAVQDPAKPTSVLDSAGLYWNAIHKLVLPPTDRARIARKFIELFEAVDINLPLPELFEFVTADGAIRSVEVEKLLLALFDSQQPLPTILRTLSSLTELLAAQSNESIRAVADKAISKFLGSDGEGFESMELSKQILDLFEVLLRSGKVDAANVSRLIHLLLRPDSVSDSLELLQQAYKSIREHSGTTSILVYAALELLHLADPVEVSKILKFVNSVCHNTATVNNEPLAAFRMYVQSAAAADVAGAEEATYELYAQALTTYEESITDSNQQVHAMAIIIQALQQATVFTTENYDPLAQRCIQHGQRLFKKPDQCRTLLKAAHLYWDNNYADSRGVEETLLRALRSADSVMDTSVSIELFLDVLDSYLYFLGNEVGTVTVSSVDVVLKLIRDNLQNAESEDAQDTKSLRARLDRIRQFVKSQQEEFPVFADLEF